MGIDEAILIMENERPHCGDKLTFTEEERYEAYTWAIGALKELSSAQFEERTEERTETHACDLISRNAALALVVKAIHGTDSEEIKDYLFGGLRKELWALPSAQPNLQPTCNQLATDVISREAAIETAARAAIDWHRLANPQYSIAYCIGEAMRQLPSAQPERKRGEWIQNDNSTYSCSLCHSWIPEEQYYYAQFCLYCGADMRGEEWECDSVNKLRSLPSAETEDRPTGEWVFDTQIPIGKGAYSAGYRCSKCGKDYFRVDGMNFCPNCGADMRGEEDDEWDGGYSRSREEIITLKLRMLPSAYREGHWIKHGEPPWYVIECSECGAKWQMSGSWDANNFCGNCGARMINTK